MFIIFHICHGFNTSLNVSFCTRIFEDFVKQILDKLTNKEFTVDQVVVSRPASLSVRVLSESTYGRHSGYILEKKLREEAISTALPLEASCHASLFRLTVCPDPGTSTILGQISAKPDDPRLSYND